MKFLLVVILSIPFISPALAQGNWKLNELTPPDDYENIHVEKLATDSLASAFVIWVKNDVRMHHHALHTESVYILEGKGKMTLGEEVYEIGPGDFFFIPSGTLHDVEVTSREPIKALSIQAPEFKGKDRIFAGQIKKEKD